MSLLLDSITLLEIGRVLLIRLRELHGIVQEVTREQDIEALLALLRHLLVSAEGLFEVRLVQLGKLLVLDRAVPGADDFGQRLHGLVLREHGLINSAKRLPQTLVVIVFLDQFSERLRLTLLLCLLGGHLSIPAEDLINKRLVAQAHVVPAQLVKLDKEGVALLRRQLLIDWLRCLLDLLFHRSGGFDLFSFFGLIGCHFFLGGLNSLLADSLVGLGLSGVVRHRRLHHRRSWLLSGLGVGGVGLFEVLCHRFDIGYGLQQLIDG